MKVLTPKGFKLIGDVGIGDQVCNPDGTVARVIAVTDNGPKQFYRVTLADGSSVEADEDHLWAVSVASHRKRRKAPVPTIPPGLRPEDEWNLRVQTRCRIVNTLELRHMVKRATANKEDGWATPGNVLLPLTNPVNLTGAPGRWDRFSPYILGALVGDGSLGGDRSVSICGVDPEIFERISAELPAHLQLNETTATRQVPTYGIVRRAAMRDDSATEAFVSEAGRLMAERGWRQANLVRAGSYNQAYLSSVLNGKRRPTVKFVEKLDDLLGGNGALLDAHAQHAGTSAVDLLRRDGLAERRSWEKFIPERIKWGPAEDRFAFTQGLMDTDGHMDQRGHVEFVTVSEPLARDFQLLLRSLGYKATLTTKTPTYVHNGVKRDGRLAYRIHIRGRHMDGLFHLPRKRERVTKFNGTDVEPFHRVVSVEPTRVDNSRCIQVDNLNHLYVTDDFIVTHNTRALLMDDLRYLGVRIGAFRRTYGELKESLLAELTEAGYASELGAVWNGAEYELRFPNGVARHVPVRRVAEQRAVGVLLGRVQPAPDGSATVTDRANGEDHQRTVQTGLRGDQFTRSALACPRAS